MSNTSGPKQNKVLTDEDIRRVSSSRSLRMRESVKFVVVCKQVGPELIPTRGVETRPPKPADWYK